MKNILFIINAILDEAIKEMKNKLGLPPLAIAAIISGASTIATKIASDGQGKKLAKKADKEAAEERIENERKAKEAVAIARGTAREGDPTLAIKRRGIQEAAATTVGKVAATSTSAQEVINAATKVQANVNQANLAAQGQAGQFRVNLRQDLANRFETAGRLRLGGQVGIDRRLQMAVDAIGANTQSNVDTVQNIGSLGIDALAFNQGFPFQGRKQPQTIRRGPGTV